MTNDSRGGKPTAVASDHAGFDLKGIIKEHLEARNVEVIDLGPHSGESVDYPDFASKLAQCILNGGADRGILVCGTGLGMSMSANRYRGIRAALCHDHFTASSARRHNDSNVLVLGGRVLGSELAIEILDTWLDADFEGDRHKRRIDKMEEPGT
ncbi:MAG: ribose 5-phosphate isomerase B [bacterium]